MNKPNYNKKHYLDMTNSTINANVSIQGTKFDRKRIIDPINDVAKMKKLLNDGKSYSEVANIFGVTTGCVKYNVDSAFRERVLKSCSGKHFGTDHISASERAEYKRKLIRAGANVFVK